MTGSPVVGVAEGEHEVVAVRADEGDPAVELVGAPPFDLLEEPLGQRRPVGVSSGCRATSSTADPSVVRPSHRWLRKAPWRLSRTSDVERRAVLDLGVLPAGATSHGLVGLADVRAQRLDQREPLGEEFRHPCGRGGRPTHRASRGPTPARTTRGVPLLPSSAGSCVAAARGRSRRGRRPAAVRAARAGRRGTDGGPTGRP